MESLVWVRQPRLQGGHDAHIGRAVRGQGLFHLGHEVFPVVRRGLGRVGHVVGGHDAREVFPALGLALDLGACGLRCRVRSEGRCAGALDAGVHIGAVVVADVQELVAALHGARQGLEPDVIGAAVAAKGDELHLLLSLPCLRSDRYMVSMPEAVAAAFSKALCIQGTRQAV